MSKPEQNKNPGWYESKKVPNTQRSSREMYGGALHSFFFGCSNPLGLIGAYSFWNAFIYRKYYLFPLFPSDEYKVYRERDSFFVCEGVDWLSESPVTGYECVEG
jgi:hypothetical protein